MTEREAAWDAVRDALPAGRTVEPPIYDPGISAWSVTARAKVPGRGKPPVTVSGPDPTRAAALRALDDRLHDVPQPDGSRMEERERRFRQTYLDGAEESSRQRLGRGLTQDELERVIRQFP